MLLFFTLTWYAVTEICLKSKQIWKSRKKKGGGGGGGEETESKQFNGPDFSAEGS